MSSQQTNQELVEQASFEVFDEGDVDRLDDLVTDDYVLYDPNNPDVIRGREAYKDYIESYRTAFPDLDVTIDAMIAEGDLVAARFTGRGTHEGPLPDAPELEPTGREIEITGMEFDRIEDGRVAETWQLFDVFGMLQQLGAISEAELPPEA